MDENIKVIGDTFSGLSQVKTLDEGKVFKAMNSHGYLESPVLNRYMTDIDRAGKSPVYKGYEFSAEMGFAVPNKYYGSEDTYQATVAGEWRKLLIHAQNGRHPVYGNIGGQGKEFVGGVLNKNGTSVGIVKKDNGKWAIFDPHGDKATTGTDFAYIAEFDNLDNMLHELKHNKNLIFENEYTFNAGALQLSYSTFIPLYKSAN